MESQNAIALLLSQYKTIQMNKILIQEELKYGLITFADATEQVAIMTNKERKLIKQAVEAVHITKDGKPRNIKLNEGKGLYYTNMPDRSQVYGKTIEALYLNLFLSIWIIN